MRGLTSVFEMGTGVAPALGTVGKPGFLELRSVSPHCARRFCGACSSELHTAVLAAESLSGPKGDASTQSPERARPYRLRSPSARCAHRFRGACARVVKSHGRLVPVSFTRCRASTSGLSTSSSRTALQGTEVPGRSHLGRGFPLRCFQRLSLPHLATRQCRWRDNRYTIGPSIPVLSY